jgi:branched-chain amino acid transport system ATP-binding protein
MRILEVQGITVRFSGLVAVAGVDFHIDRGEVVGLIGPNGAGKTTLFNLISGAITPSSGTTVFKGEDITRLKPSEICRRGIARTFQLVKLFSDMTVLENVMLSCLFRKPRVTKEEAVKESLELLDFVGLNGMESLPARELPIGGQKRLEVARALATHPELLLLDEVMAGLNPAEVSEAIESIKQIREKGITIMLVEHVMQAIMDVSDRVIVLHNGEKLAEGMPCDITTNETVISVYLGGTISC